MSIFNKKTQKPVFFKHIHKDINVQDYVVEITTREDFVNDSSNSVELVYKYPSTYSPHYLRCEFTDPETGKTEVLVGKIRGKEQAQEMYDDSVSSGNRALLMEKTGEVYSILSLGNVKPKLKISVVTKVLVELECEFDEDVSDLVIFVLRVCKIFPVVDVNKIEIDKNMLSVNINVNIQTGSIENVKSVSHPESLLMTEKSESKMALKSEKNLDVTKDFMVKIRVKNYPISTALLSPVEYKKYKFASVVSILPNFPRNYKREADWYLVVDCSGSMRGTRIEYCRQALQLFIKSLDIDHKISINIIRFGSTFQAMYDSPTRIDEDNVEDMLKYVDDLEADLGGTKMIEPLKYVLEMSKARSKDLQKYIDQGVCTYHLTGEDYGTQKFFHCETCGLVDDCGCCESCLKVCHVGHNTWEKKDATQCYCDCGAEKKVCKLENKKFAAPESIVEKEITDGEDDTPAETLELVRKQYKKSKARMFSFAIGRGANPNFCREIANITMGSACFIEDDSQMKNLVLGQLTCAMESTVQDMEIEMKGLGKKDILKVRSTSKKMIFNGKSYHEFYFLKKPPSEVEFSYSYEEKKGSESFRPILYHKDQSLNTLTARHYASDLENSGKSSKEITEIGKKFNLVTSHTSYFLENEAGEAIKGSLQSVEIKMSNQSISKSLSSKRLGKRSSKTKARGKLFADIQRGKDRIMKFKMKKVVAPSRARKRSANAKGKYLKQILDGGYNNTGGSYGGGGGGYGRRVPRSVSVSSSASSSSSRPRRSRGRASRPKKGSVNLKGIKKSPKRAPVRTKDSHKESLSRVVRNAETKLAEYEVEKSLYLLKSEEKREEKDDVSACVSESNLVDLLIASTIRGIFKCSAKVCGLIGVSMSSVRNSKPKDVNDIDLWMTAIVCAVLNTYYATDKAQWKLVEKKSKRCLKNHTKIVADAQKFVNSL